MGQLRVGFQRVSAGSAARQAEEERREQCAAPSLRIAGGSAARAAEAAKKLGADPFSGAAGFSLRAQGGRVLRTDPRSGAPSSTAPASEQVPSRAPAAPLSPSLPRAPVAAVRSTEVSPDVLPARVSPPPHGAGRLQTFLRGFFRPDQPSNP